MTYFKKIFLFYVSSYQHYSIYNSLWQNKWNLFSWTVSALFPFCWEITMTYYCKTIAILLRNSAILLTYCSIEYCNNAIPQHYCYCIVQYSEKLLTVSLALVDFRFYLTLVRFYIIFVKSPKIIVILRTKSIDLTRKEKYFKLGNPRFYVKSVGKELWICQNWFHVNLSVRKTSKISLL